MIRIPSPSECRWLWPPPNVTAHFSRARRPGVVFRVSRMMVGYPRTAARKREVSVATPERCWRKLRTTRSAIRSERASPCAASTDAPLPTRVPSATARTILTEGSTSSNTWRAAATPARIMASWALTVPLARTGSGTSIAVVGSPRIRSSPSAAWTALRICRVGTGMVSSAEASSRGAAARCSSECPVRGGPWRPVACVPQRPRAAPSR